MQGKFNRRDFLGKSVATASAAGLVAAGNTSPVAASPPQQPESTVDAKKPLETEAGMPQGRIGNVTLSRVILGSNLMTGFSHSRDLRYVGPLMRAYNSE